MEKRKDLEKILMDYGQLMGKKNFTPGTSGNISCRFGENILITTSGSATGYLEEDEIVEIDFNGDSLDKNRKPSSEKFMHIKIYQKRPDINVILHVHSPYLSSFAAAGIPLDKPVMAENTFYFGTIPLSEYALPSTMELADNVAKYFDKHNAVLMENHGFIIASDNIKDAYLKLELAESYAQIVLNTYILGGAKLLSKAQVEAIEALK